MAIKVFRVADIVASEVVFVRQQHFKPGDVAVVLTNLEPPPDPATHSSWKMEIEIGKGSELRLVKLDLPPMLSRHDSLEDPIFIAEGKIIYFRDHLFMPERIPRTVSEKDEVILRVKKNVYDDEASLSSLRAAVANLEAAVEYKKNGPKRDAIPEDVKLLVWARDGGACVYCGAKSDLHFDHIIPVAKGGGNSAENIQVLCRKCNLVKSDKIAMN